LPPLALGDALANGGKQYGLLSQALLAQGNISLSTVKNVALSQHVFYGRQRDISLRQQGLWKQAVLLATVSQRASANAGANHPRAEQAASASGTRDGAHSGYGNGVSARHQGRATFPAPPEGYTPLPYPECAPSRVPDADAAWFPADAFTLLAPQAEASREDQINQLSSQWDRAASGTLLTDLRPAALIHLE
jgi:hypothetical protein